MFNLNLCPRRICMASAGEINVRCYVSERKQDEHTCNSFRICVPIYYVPAFMSTTWMNKIEQSNQFK